MTTPRGDILAFDNNRRYSITVVGTVRKRWNLRRLVVWVTKPRVASFRRLLWNQTWIMRCFQRQVFSSHCVDGVGIALAQCRGWCREMSGHFGNEMRCAGSGSGWCEWCSRKYAGQWYRVFSATSLLPELSRTSPGFTGRFAVLVRRAQQLWTDIHRQCDNRPANHSPKTKASASHDFDRGRSKRIRLRHPHGDLKYPSVNFAGKSPNPFTTIYPGVHKKRCCGKPLHCDERAKAIAWYLAEYRRPHATRADYVDALPHRTTDSAARRHSNRFRWLPTCPRAAVLCCQQQRRRRMAPRNASAYCPSSLSRQRLYVAACANLKYVEHFGAWLTYFI